MARWATICVGVAAALAVAAGGTYGSVPEGPRLATVELINTRGSERPENAAPPLVSLSTLAPSGTQRRRLAFGKLEGNGKVIPLPFYGPSWSGDGSQIAFMGSTSEQGPGHLYLAASDGGGAQAIPGTKGAIDPVFSPDGSTLAFARSRSLGAGFRSSTATWTVDLSTGKAQRLTRWRNGLDNYPAFFLPDGTGLALVKHDNHLDGARVVLVDLAAAGTQELLRDASEPALSPDGSQIAFAGYLHPDVVEAEEGRDYLAPDLYVARTDGTGIRRLTRTDNVIESSPSWDPSGQRLAYVRVKADTSFVPGLGLLFPFGNSLMEINADGSCGEKIASSRKVAFYGVAWQPGAGRGAGRIDC